MADYATRQEVAVASKERVAAAAATLVRPGGVAILDGGTTTLAVVAALPRDLAATIVTHSPTIATALADHTGIEVQILGGRLFRHSMVTCGAAAVEAAQGISADVFLLGVTGVHHEAGLTTGDADEAAMKRALSRRAADTFVLASAEKVGAASPFLVLPISDVSGIVTDAPADDPTIARIAATGSRVIHG
jgi:DeoR/GlpR family transcriptional regulator of sugar metabolism